jgi:hypothetical protein
MMSSDNSAGPAPLPSLPIINLEPPPRSDRQKYGSFFLAAVGGLVLVVSLVGWFGYRAWSLRDVWARVYVLHDRSRPDDDRIRAAFALARDPRFEQRQRWETSLRLGLPDLARCLLAEGVGPELVADDPQAFVSAVARSPEWPGWLRLALTRPLALASTEGHTLSRERLRDLCWLEDPVIRLWALYTLAVQPRPDPQTAVEIEKVAHDESAPEHELAGMLLEATRGRESERPTILARAAEWNRLHHPDTRRVWTGWRIVDGRLERTSAG